MVNMTTSKRAIFSKIRALEIQSYLGHNAFMQTDHLKVSDDAWKEAHRCFDLGRRAHEQKMELIEKLWPLLRYTKNAEYYYDELTALREKYRPSHWM